IDTRRIVFGLWAPDRDTFVTKMKALTNPVTQTALLGENDEWSKYVRCVELGPVLKTPATFDANGDEDDLAVYVEGHHVDMYAVGPLAGLLAAGMPTTGNIFETTRILDFLDALEWTASSVGEPDGYVGSTGV